MLLRPPGPTLFPYTTLFRSFSLIVAFDVAGSSATILAPPAGIPATGCGAELTATLDRKSTRLNSSHVAISYAVFCLKKKTNTPDGRLRRRHSLHDTQLEQHE